MCEQCDVKFGYGPDKKCTSLLYGFDPQEVTRVYPDGWKPCHGHGNITTDESEMEICVCNNSNETGYFNSLSACAQCAIDVVFPLHDVTKTTVACTPLT